MEKLNELPQAFYGVIQDGKVVMLPADDGQWLNKTTVVEAFRALERTADVNMAAAQAMRDDMYHWKHRSEAAEAKLAELEKKRNPDYFLNRIESSDKWGPEVELRIYESQLDASKSQDDHGGGIIELFTRPATAADLADLVPDELTREAWRQLFINEDYQDTFRCGFSACRAAILRNIEEAK